MRFQHKPKVDFDLAFFCKSLKSCLNQLQRAALSIPLNIAEGAGEYAPDEKARFYRIAKRSATECAGVLDVCQRLELVEEKRYTTGRELLINIVSMLVKMVQRH